MQKRIINKLKRIKVVLSLLEKRVDEIIELCEEPPNNFKRRDRMLLRDYYQLWGGNPPDKYDARLYQAASLIISGKKAGKTWEHYLHSFHYAKQFGCEPITLSQFVLGDSG